MYDKYYAKHCARLYGWLPAGLEYREAHRRRPLKYFTLSAEEALDIFMFESAGVLQRDTNLELPNVFICEKDTSVASKILSVVRPPLKEAIFVGALDVILTFEEDSHTRGRGLDDDDKNFNIRQKLKVRRDFLRLQSSFPFDMINFDPYGNLLDKNRDSNKRLFKSFEKIFELQAASDQTSFLMFITIPTADIHPEFMELFRENLNENIAEFVEIQESLNAQFDTTDFDAIEEKNRIAIGFAKSVVIPLAKKYSWQCEHKGVYIYENRDGRNMASSVVLFNRYTEFDVESYVGDIINIIDSMPNFYPYSEPFEDEVVVGSVAEIVDYRETIKAQFGS